MPALRTEVTEIVTGLAMLGFPDIDHALAVRPQAVRNVTPENFDRLEQARSSGQLAAEFDNLLVGHFQHRAIEYRHGIVFDLCEVFTKQYLFRCPGNSLWIAVKRSRPDNLFCLAEACMCKSGE